MKKIIVTDYDKSLLSELKKLGYAVLNFSKVTDFKSFLGCHTDIFFCKIKDTLFVSDLIERSFIDLNFSDVKTVICSGVQEGYPKEAALNCLYLGGKIICNKNTVSKEILSYAYSNKIDIIHVNQGYTKCSVCTVGENACITEDRSIAKTLKEAGIAVLLVQKGLVNLFGYDYGFIGGASFYDSNNKTLYFYGNIHNTPYGEEITSFCLTQGINVECLIKDKDPNDYGSAVIL